MTSRRLALIIGNSEYQDANLSQLTAPNEDVNDLAEVLRDAKVGGFDIVTTVINKPAATVRREIARFFAERKRDDMLVLYFSGHGVRDDRGDLYLAVRDTERDLLSATAIPATFVTDEVDRTRSRRVVLILDCCHSGAFSRGMKGTAGESVGTATAFEGTGYGRVVLTASDSTQYAWEGDQVIGQADNSIFTHHLVHGLRSGEADSDGDGRITVDELFDYVYERVVSETSKQTPGKWAYKEQGQLIIARNPHPADKPAALPPELQQAVESSLAGVREGAVHELERLLRGSDPGVAEAAQIALAHLAEDDSRRVSAAAAAALAGEGRPTIPTTPPSPPAEAMEQPAAESIVVEGRARPAIPTTTPLPPVEPTAVERTKARPATPTTTAPRPAEPGEFSMSTIVSGSTIGGAIGWAVAGAIVFGVLTRNFGGIISGAIGAALGGAIGGAIGGGITGLALRKAGPAVSRKQWRSTALYWAAAVALAGSIGAIVGALSVGNDADSVGEAFAEALGMLLVGFFGMAVSILLVGAIAGLVIGLRTRRVVPAIGGKNVAGITLGWWLGGIATVITMFLAAGGLYSLLGGN